MGKQIKSFAAFVFALVFFPCVLRAEALKLTYKCEAITVNTGGVEVTNLKTGAKSVPKTEKAAGQQVMILWPDAVYISNSIIKSEKIYDFKKKRIYSLDRKKGFIPLIHYTATYISASWNSGTGGCWPRLSSIPARWTRQTRG